MAKKPGKANFRKAIEEHGGVISEIAAHFDVSRKTIYNWRDHYEAHDIIRKARVAMRDVAEDVMYQVLVSEPAPDDDKALDRQIGVAKFTLQHTNQAGQFITLSDEVLHLMRLINLSVDDASTLFEDMVREAARQKQLQLAA